MQRKTLAFVFAAAVLGLAAVATAEPMLSGNYAYSITSPCRASIGTTKDGQGDVISVDRLAPGELYEEIGTAAFSPTTVSLTGHRVQGDLLFVEGHTGRNVSAPVAVSRADVPYSTTSGTLTLDGTTYRAVYANIVSGIARYFVFLGRDGNDCPFRGTMMKK